MGCMNSKSGGDAGAGYATLGVEKLDGIFTKAQAVTDKGNGMKDSIDGGKTTIFKNTGMQWLKEPTLLTALQAWMVSAVCDCKDPEAFKPEITMEEPYVEVPEDCGLSEANKETKTAIQEYFKALKEAPDTLKAMTDDMQGIVDEATAAKDTAADDFASLGMMEKAKAAKNLPGNMKKLTAAQTELQEIPNVLKAATEDVQKAIAGLPDAIKGAKEIAEKTKSAGTGTDAVTVAKTTLSGDKNDDAAAAKIAETWNGGGDKKEGDDKKEDDKNKV